jgi:hypothetical protein
MVAVLGRMLDFWIIGISEGIASDPASFRLLWFSAFHLLEFSLAVQ